MLAANLEMGNIFLHTGQAVDISTERVKKRVSDVSPKCGKEGAFVFLIG
jgi:hypothetical protein